MKPYRGGAAQIRASVGVAAARVCLYKSQKEANDARDYFVLPHQYTKIFSHETERIGDHLWQLMVALFLFAKEKKKPILFISIDGNVARTQGQHRENTHQASLFARVEFHVMFYYTPTLNFFISYPW